MMGTLRNDPGAVGLVSANGGFLTKHAIGLYSTEPPTKPFRAEDVQDEVDRIPTTPAAEDHVGPVTVEAYTVMHGHDGPEKGLCALRTPDGARTWGQVTDLAAAAAMTNEDVIGRSGNVDGQGVLTLS